MRNSLKALTVTLTIAGIFVAWAVKHRAHITDHILTVGLSCLAIYLGFVVAVFFSILESKGEFTYNDDLPL